jgi:hypothetical protein
MNVSSTVATISACQVHTPAPFGIASDLAKAIADDFRAVPQVHGVDVEYVENAVLVWIGTNNPSRELRHQIYAKQMGLMEAFPDVMFDFNLVHAE